MLQNYFTFLLMDKNNLLENSHTLKHSVFVISWIQLQQPGRYQAYPLPNLTKQFIRPRQFFNKLLKHDLQSRNAQIKSLE